MRVFKSVVLTGILGMSVSSVSSAAILGAEVGGIFGASINSVNAGNLDADTTFAVGAYGKLWLKPGMLRIAPFVKWESVGSLDDKVRYNNFQYGGLIGVHVSKITPYVGIAYSHFTNTALEHTWAVNYGVHVSLPAHITIGIEASYQSPKLSGIKVDINRVSATLGVQF
ncbi:outer membrane beta-barrel protein [Helicobacter saguini]|uniref:Outer membrane beta-barrel protein n=1 Tax=Helicobacter saguini TaxID=1548018 RepID=A0A347VRL2_9HELI|nr:outer membrane beta-barrel protein [Helicobacter saguini]MWV62861.1 outer membrane beta-barrel protein [Helicobacter saguini]MWV66468.1 outer membrane beta-barrel protein [Helicobacter saguini]MWV68818.1 outer membrane beta-barrel protein [Helicobacter saguini]MWV71627.1 outer membrane beta-barrel protein [Helicobacter saguini]TLD94431.1 hypothetical protein LS64_005750 [Helicobacter saguini]